MLHRDQDFGRQAQRRDGQQRHRIRHLVLFQNEDCVGDKARHGMGGAVSWRSGNFGANAHLGELAHHLL
jgi:hypothetical protein